MLHIQFGIRVKRFIKKDFTQVLTLISFTLVDVLLVLISWILNSVISLLYDLDWVIILYLKLGFALKHRIHEPFYN